MSKSEYRNYINKVHKVLGIKNITLKQTELAILILDKNNKRQPKTMTKEVAKRIVSEFMRDYGISYSRAIKKIEKGCSFVYFIQHDGGQRDIKIGKADDVLRRISELQTGSPYPLVLLHSIHAENSEHAFAIESMLHERLKKYRLLGEWFKFECLNDVRDIFVPKIH
jgi:hypothetical protein